MLIQYPIKKGRDSTGSCVSVYFSTSVSDPFETDPKRIHRNFKKFIQDQLWPGEKTIGTTGMVYRPETINVGKLPERTAKCLPHIKVWRVERDLLAQ